MQNLMLNMLAVTALVFAIALPQVQAQELSPQEQMIHRRAVEAAVWGMPIEGTRGLLLGAQKDELVSPMPANNRFSGRC